MRALLCLALALPMSVGASADTRPESGAVPVLDQELPLTEMAGTAVASDAGITVTFAWLTRPCPGFGGCNTYNATWQSDGTTLTVGPIAATRKSCGTDVDALESQYLGLLQAAASWSLNGSALEIVTADGSTLVYGGTAAEPAIVGAWQLSTFGGTPVPNGIVATAVFGADGTLTGSGGCNTYSAPLHPRWLVPEHRPAGRHPAVLCRYRGDRTGLPRYPPGRHQLVGGRRQPDHRGHHPARVHATAPRPRPRSRASRGRS